jgi:3-dehydroquinate synthase
MQSIAAGQYDIHFNEAAYPELARWVERNAYSKLFLLADTHTAELCLPHFLANLATGIPIEIIEIEAGEHVKSLETCGQLWDALGALGADRKAALVNVGGGVVTDIGGFVASAYMRGIGFINVPTTLLGMVDAAIGGKNGIDVGHLKNRVGTIVPPQMVVIDTKFLGTLPQPQMRSGLAEMLKHGLIADASYWKKFENLSRLDFADLDSLIHRSVEIKNAIVCEDPGETGIRKALNFGHTLGHAIESHFLQSEKPILHGEAVAAGLVMESFLSVKKGWLGERDFGRIKKSVDAAFDKLGFDENDIAAITALLAQDKKNEYGKVLFVLLDGIGRVRIGQTVDGKWIPEAFAAYAL